MVSRLPGRAIDGAQTTLSAVLAKARFWERIQGVPLNDRQRLVLNRLLDGFEGKLTTSKYAKLAKCSQDTALRDILRWSNAAFWSAIPKAAAARVMRLGKGSRSQRRPSRGACG